MKKQWKQLKIVATEKMSKLTTGCPNMFGVNFLKEVFQSSKWLGKSKVESKFILGQNSKDIDENHLTWPNYCVSFGMFSIQNLSGYPVSLHSTLALYHFQKRDSCEFRFGFEVDSWVIDFSMGLLS